MERQTIFRLIRMERERQNQLHPENKHSPMEWAAILAEECGEAVKELNNLHEGKEGAEVKMVVHELIQTAAVCVRILEGV